MRDGYRIECGSIECHLILRADIGDGVLTEVAGDLALRGGPVVCHAVGQVLLSILLGTRC